ncbi:hypothetical protein WJX73_001203 [Symbiochloris irregularis]|uniref:Uncharacterized protein n=1 Tax=Symbiochloris irregularis TaxID=706552 RepID=A0AAW1NMY7_9CHLO
MNTTEIATCLGVGVGFTVAAAISPFLFRNAIPLPDLSEFSVSADGDEKIQRYTQRDGETVPASMRRYLPYAPDWTSWPDFQRVTWMNHMLKTFWPWYNKAIGQMILEQMKPMMDETIAKIPFLQAVDFEAIDLGTKPMQIGGIKTYQTSEDEIIFESPGSWGSNSRIRIGIRLKFGPLVFYVPIEVQDLQMKAVARMTMRPLVETLPCIGAVNVSLMQVPYIDASLFVGNRLDLMQLPGIKQLTAFAVEKVMGDMMLYPNSMTFDIMEGGGIQPPPQGILQVTVVRIPKLTGGGDLLSKVDPYVKCSVRDNRISRTQTLSNTNKPVWNETFDLIVDDPNLQSLTLIVMDDDLGAFDDEIGTAEVPLLDADFIKNPRQEFTHHVMLLKPEAATQLIKYAKAGMKGQERAGKAGVTALRRDTQQQMEEDDDQSTGGTNNQPGLKHEGTLDTNEAAKHDPAGSVGELELRLKYLPFRATGASPGAGGHQGGHMQGLPPTANASQGEPKGLDALDGHARPSSITTKPGEKGKEQQGEASRQQGELSRPPTPPSPSSSHKGILTITLVRAFNLEAHGTVDAFVAFRLQDPTKEKEDRHVSRVIPNEPNPRWGDKFDFVLVDSSSVLHLNVYDKKGGLESLLSLKTLTGHREKEEHIGELRIKVQDVVRNERLRDTWALQGVQRGDIDLMLDWTAVVLDE